MIWLTRNNKADGFFSPQKWEVYACSVIRLLSAWVHWQSALLAQQAWMTSHHERQKNYGLHMIAHNHKIVHANQSTHTYFFLKQTGKSNKFPHHGWDTHLKISFNQSTELWKDLSLKLMVKRFLKSE